MPYIDGVGWKRGDTSRQAAQSVAPNTRTIRMMILRALRLHGPHTPDEMAEHLGLSPLSVRPRFSELMNGGPIRDTGDKRPSSLGNPSKVYAYRCCDECDGTGWVWVGDGQKDHCMCVIHYGDYLNPKETEK